MYKRILVPVDGSEQAQKGLEVACAIAEHDKAKLILLCIAEPAVSYEMAESAIQGGLLRPTDFRQFLDTLDYTSIAPAQSEATREMVFSKLVERIAGEVVEKGTAFAQGEDVPEILSLVRSGVPATEIVASAKENDVGLIVMASGGVVGRSQLLYPSIAEAVRSEASCPCLFLYD